MALCGFSQVRLCLTGLWEAGETHGVSQGGTGWGPMCLTLRIVRMARTCVAGMAGACVGKMARTCGGNLRGGNGSDLRDGNGGDLRGGNGGDLRGGGGERMDVTRGRMDAKRKLGKCFAGWMEKSNFASRLLSTFE